MPAQYACSKSPKQIDVSARLAPRFRERNVLELLQYLPRYQVPAIVVSSSATSLKSKSHALTKSNMNSSSQIASKNRLIRSCRLGWSSSYSYLLPVFESSPVPFGTSFGRFGLGSSRAVPVDKSIARQLGKSHSHILRVE